MQYNNRISMLISQSNNDQDHNHSFGVYDNNGNNGHGNNTNNDEHYKNEYHYTNDVSLALPEPIQVSGADPLHWKQSYVYGVGGERVSMTQWNLNDHNNDNHSVHKDDSSPSSKTQYYLSGALGSVIGLMNEKGGMSARYHYDEFGVPSMPHNNDNNANSSKNMFGYTGLGYDETSGLNYARARYYKPEIGRFISEDTYKGTLGNPQSQNGYAYVWNNPLKYNDPSGHCLEDACIGEAALIGFLFDLAWTSWAATHPPSQSSSNSSSNSSYFEARVVDQPKDMEGGSIEGQSDEGPYSAPQSVGEKLASQGKKVKFIPKDKNSIDKSPDLEVDGVKTEVKAPTSTDPSTIAKRIKEGFKQTGDDGTVVVDGRSTGLTEGQAKKAIAEAGRKGNIKGKVEIWIAGNKIITYL